MKKVYVAMSADRMHSGHLNIVRTAAVRNYSWPEASFI